MSVPECPDAVKPNLSKIGRFSNSINSYKNHNIWFSLLLGSCTSLNMSIERLGVKILTRASSIAAWGHQFSIINHNFFLGSLIVYFHE